MRVHVWLLDFFKLANASNNAAADCLPTLGQLISWSEEMPSRSVSRLMPLDCRAWRTEGLIHPIRVSASMLAGFSCSIAEPRSKSSTRPHMSRTDSGVSPNSLPIRWNVLPFARCCAMARSRSVGGFFIVRFGLLVTSRRPHKKLGQFLPERTARASFKDGGLGGATVEHPTVLNHQFKQRRRALPSNNYFPKEPARRDRGFESEI